MGAWNYLSTQLAPLVKPNITLDVVARPDRSSPAAGFMDLFLAEQEQIIGEALGLLMKEHGGSYVH
jgi:2-oxoglutarate dehydrogenase E1 component